MKDYDSHYDYKDITGAPIVLDFSGCKSQDEVHLILKESLGCTGAWEGDWPGFWDHMLGIFNGKGDIDVKIYGYDSLPKDLKIYCITLMECFDRLHRSTSNLTFHLIS